MATTTDVLDKRLTDLETIVWDIPSLLTVRTAKYEASFAEISIRLDKLERAVAMLQTDVRDLRNGVARFMAESDARMRSLEARMERLEAEFDRHRTETNTRFDTIDSALAEILRRLPAA